MKTASSFVLGAALVASGWMAAPQAATPANIAVINGEQVLGNSNVGQQARQRLEAAAADWEERISTATQELQALQRQRQEQALTLNEAALSRLNQDIEEKQVEVQRMNDDARRELGRLQDQITVEVNRQLGPLVDQFAADQNLDMIFDISRAQSLLYFSNERDVTDQFLAVVNQQMSQEEGTQQ